MQILHRYCRVMSIIAAVDLLAFPNDHGRLIIFIGGCALAGFWVIPLRKD